MRKCVSVNKSNGVVNIDIEIDLDNRKSQLRVTSKKAEDRFSNLLKKVKVFSKFDGLSLSYNEIDHYDNIVDVYETPYIFFNKGKGKRKATVSATEHGCIPKDWSETFSLKLENPKTIKPIEIFLSNFNITLTRKQVMEVRKAMKVTSSFYSEI